MYYNLTFDKNPGRNHIVLAPTKIKPSIISNSQLLDYYLEYFSRALQESDFLYLIGYSGNDTHINIVIKNWIKHIKKLIIIEWNDSHVYNERKE